MVVFGLVSAEWDLLYSPVVVLPVVPYWTALPVSRLLSGTVYGRCSEWWGRNCCRLRQSRTTATAAENCKPGVELMTNSVNPRKLCRTSNLTVLYSIYGLATSSLNIEFSSLLRVYSQRVRYSFRIRKWYTFCLTKNLNKGITVLM